jgi:hypothetical protein
VVPLQPPQMPPPGIYGHMSHDIVDKFRSVRTDIQRLIADGRVEGVLGQHRGGVSQIVISRSLRTYLWRPYSIVP